MASLANIFRTGASTVVKVFGDANTLVTYSHVVPGNYDPDTGNTADVVTTSDPFLTPVLRADDKEQASFPGAKNVQVVIVPYAQLQAKGISPSMSDYFTVAGVRWEVLRIRAVPTQAITKFYVETP